MNAPCLPMGVRIAWAEDASTALTDLLCELNAHYADAGVATAPRATVHAHLRDHLLARGAPARLVVASDAAGTALGLAAIVLLDSLVDPAPAHRRQCMVKELFVSAQARGLGLGRALMAWVAGYAAAEGCGRMDWNVVESNASGIAFYESLGARQVTNRLSYRLSREAMGQLAAPRAPSPTTPRPAP